MIMVKNIYLEHCNKNDVVAFLNSCINLRYIINYYIILHDKDVLENGETKKEHFHILVDNNNGYKEFKKEVVKRLYSKALFENVRSPKTQARYLMHLDDLEKYQYSIEEIVTNDLDAYKELIKLNKVGKKPKKEKTLTINDCIVQCQDLCSNAKEMGLNAISRDAIKKIFSDNEKLAYYIQHINILQSFLQQDYNIRIVNHKEEEEGEKNE